MRKSLLDVAVLAAFENDLLVRDPDTSIAGTSIQRVTVAEGQAVTMAESFKITEHLAIVSPGAEGPEVVSGTPVFRWADDSSEDRYELEVYSALGDLVWADRAVPGVSGSATVEHSYAGPALLQVQGGKPVVVGPARFAEAKPVFPVPKWRG